MAKMIISVFILKSLFFFWYRFLLKQLKSLLGFRRSISNSYATQFKYQKYPSLLQRSTESDFHDHTLIFDVEGALLKCGSVFPYLMLVAFEAGGLVRAILLILAYPLVWLVGAKVGLEIMVMICFCGVKAKSFRVGRAVLPKFLLEKVGSQVFQVLNKGGKKVGVSCLPRVMVESFLKEYLEIDVVVARELKVFCGYYSGFMEHTKPSSSHALDLEPCSNLIAVTGLNKTLDYQLLSRCKEVYVVTEGEKRRWKRLEREKYPKALVFHDGRLAMRPTLVNAIAMLIWAPYALILSILRIFIAVSLPYSVSTPILSFTGLRLTASTPNGFSYNNNNNNNNNKSNGHLYVSNHRTLLDPLYVSFALKKNLIAVTYSLSRMSEILAPIKTVRLTRDRNEDGEMMNKLLKQGDLAVCPEGTTCREPYLLRFSPLFSEMCDEITPVAVDCHVSMFHGTTAGGLKCLDPVFFLMNPSASYSVRFLRQVSRPRHHHHHDEAAASRFEVANRVQTQIADALGFQCTKLTRKDKYLMLAGNDGLVVSSNDKS